MCWQALNPPPPPPLPDTRAPRAHQCAQPSPRGGRSTPTRHRVGATGRTPKAARRSGTLLSWPEAAVARAAVVWRAPLLSRANRHRSRRAPSRVATVFGSVSMSMQSLMMTRSRMRSRHSFQLATPMMTNHWRRDCGAHRRCFRSASGAGRSLLSHIVYSPLVIVCTNIERQLICQSYLLLIDR